MAGNRDFDPDRMEELVLYIAWKTKDDPRFGRVKLAKVLFYSDLACYADRGESYTGAVYQHWPFGPFPPALYAIEERLAERGLADVQRLSRSEEQVAELKIIPHREPQFAGDHVVDSYIRKISELPSWRVSDESHKHPGWLLTKDYEEIPYHVAYMSRRQPTEDDFARGEELAVEHGWP